LSEDSWIDEEKEEEVRDIVRSERNVKEVRDSVRRSERFKLRAGIPKYLGAKEMEGS
jgi:hypothetical protein